MTTGKRLILWTLVADQPALFLRYVRDSYPPRPTRMPSKVTMEFEVWLYSDVGKNPNVAPAEAMSRLLDAVEDSLVPRPAFDALTLGGMVTDAWIEGVIDIHPGDLDGQAIAIVPVKVLVPSIKGS